MPLEKGGRADKKGNQYETNCIIYEILKVLNEINYSVVVEALGTDEIGTDILITTFEGIKEHQQCKARNASKISWGISDLKAKDILSAWKIQLNRNDDRKVALVSPMECSFLVDLNDRAHNTSGKAEDFYNIQILESSKEFRKFYESFCKEMGVDIKKNEYVLKSIDYLQRIYYKRMSEYELQELINQSIQFLFISERSAVYNAFVSFVVTKDILGKEYLDDLSISIGKCSDGSIGYVVKNSQDQKVLYSSTATMTYKSYPIPLKDYLKCYSPREFNELNLEFILNDYYLKMMLLENREVINNLSLNEEELKFIPKINIEGMTDSDKGYANYFVEGKSYDGEERIFIDEIPVYYYLNKIRLSDLLDYFDLLDIEQEEITISKEEIKHYYFRYLADSNEKFGYDYQKEDMSATSTYNEYLKEIGITLSDEDIEYIYSLTLTFLSFSLSLPMCVCVCCECVLCVCVSVYVRVCVCMCVCV